MNLSGRGRWIVSGSAIDRSRFTKHADASSIAARRGAAVQTAPLLPIDAFLRLSSGEQTLSTNILAT
jgi:hypothetical protein